jgi:succinoglycan biosynthesis transport protein ExoP
MMTMQETMHEEEIHLLEYWNILWQRKLMLIALFSISVVITMVVSLKMPKYYKSEAVIIAAGSEAGGLGAALSVIPFSGVLSGAISIPTPADKIMVILKSRSIAEAVIRKFDLLKTLYDKEWDSVSGTWKHPDKHPLMEDAVKLLTNKIVQFKKSKEGAITVGVEWKDPQLAAEIANYYINSLTGFLNEKAINLTIQVVDKAVPAERKSGPKTGQNMLVAGVLSLSIGVLSVICLDNLFKKKHKLFLTGK